MVNSGPCPWRPSPVRACHEKEAAGQTLGRGRRGFLCLRDRGEAKQADTGPVPLLQVAGSDKGVGSTDSAQVDHCTVIGHLYRLSDAGLAAFQHLEFVHSVLHTQWQDFVPWKPLPERQAQLRCGYTPAVLQGLLWVTGKADWKSPTVLQQAGLATPQA